MRKNRALFCLALLLMSMASTVYSRRGGGGRGGGRSSSRGGGRRGGGRGSFRGGRRGGRGRGGFRRGGFRGRGRGGFGFGLGYGGYPYYGGYYSPYYYGGYYGRDRYYDSYEDRGGYTWWEITNDTPYTINVKSRSGGPERIIRSGETKRLEHPYSFRLRVKTYDGERLRESFTTRDHNIKVKLDDRGGLTIETWNK